MLTLAGALPVNADEIVERIIRTLLRCRVTRRQVVLIGNGGSYTTAAHWGVDLEKLGFDTKVIDIAVLTARGNDDGYQSTFAEKHYQDKLLIAFSASGRSPNIVTAASRYAESILMTSARHRCATTYSIIFPVQSDNFGIIEDIHLIIGHFICHKLKDCL
jgi:phosphoheptose isomerase